MKKNRTYYCETCDNSIAEGKYCPDCGLHYSGQKSSIQNIFKDLLAQVFSVEKGIIHNFSLTFSRPKTVVWSYFNGIRNKYAAPGHFLLYALFILGALHLIAPEIGFLNLSFDGEVDNQINGNKFFLIFIIPLLTVTSKIVFWKSARGIALHVITIIYLFIPRFVIASLFIALFNLTVGEHWIQSIITLFLMLHALWTNVTVQKQAPSVLEKLGFTLLQIIVFLTVLFVSAFFFIALLQINVTFN